MPIYISLSTQAKAIENHGWHTTKEKIELCKNPRVYRFWGS